MRKQDRITSVKMFKFLVFILIHFICASYPPKHTCLPSDCIPFHKCDALYDLYENYVFRKPKEFAQLLASYHCGHDRVFGPKVCCNRKSNKLFPPDVLQHPNLAKINGAECGKAAISTQIVHGQDAGLGQVPWMALVLVMDGAGDNLAYCGASLINARYVLTAAHCLADYPVANVSVRLGAYDLSKDEECSDGVDGKRRICSKHCDLRSEKLIKHPDYKRGMHDIGLIRLNQSVGFEFGRKPICLPTSEAMRLVLMQEEPTDLVVLGWGLVDEGDGSSSVLQKATISMLSHADCRKYYSSPSFSRLTHACGFNKTSGSDSCRGDSGGPLQKFVDSEGRYYQLGIVSFGKKCGSEPGVYVNVASYMDWILNNLE